MRMVESFLLRNLLVSVWLRVVESSQRRVGVDSLPDLVILGQ